MRCAAADGPLRAVEGVGTLARVCAEEGAGWMGGDDVEREGEVGDWAERVRPRCEGDEGRGLRLMRETAARSRSNAEAIYMYMYIVWGVIGEQKEDQDSR